jgi:hypothetical protein
MKYLLGIIAVLGGVIAWLFGKEQTASALTQNVDVKNQVNALDTKVAHDQGQLADEAAKRQQEQASLQQQENSMQSIQDLDSFLNRDLSKGPDDK